MELNLHVTKAESEPRHNANLGRQLSNHQLAAIRLAAAIGDDIRKNYPQLVEEYRSGLTAPQLVVRHAFDRRYGVSRRTAIAAVRNAIRGHSGHFYESYEGLIADRSEREHLALAHNRQTGTEAYRGKLGIHAMTRQQRADAGRKGGLIRGQLSYRLRIGCHALPPELLREHCRKIAPLGGKAGGLASVLAQGMVPYAPPTPGRAGEIEFAVHLSTDPLYLGPVRANFRKIAEEVNKVFHSGNPRYTRTTLKIAVQSYRRHVRSSGALPPDPEMSLADRLVCDPAYQLPARIRAAEIARKVNEEYHGGQPVRNSVSVRAAIRRYRKQAAILPDG